MWITIDTRSEIIAISGEKSNVNYNDIKVYDDILGFLNSEDNSNYIGQIYPSVDSSYFRNCLNKIRGIHRDCESAPEPAVSKVVEEVVFKLLDKYKNKTLSELMEILKR